MALQVTVAKRASDMIDLRRGLDDVAKFAMLAKRPSGQGLRTRNLSPVSRAVICAIGRAITHVDLPVLMPAVLAAGVGRSPLPCAKMAALDHRRDLRLPSDRRPRMHGEAGQAELELPVSSWTTTKTDNGAGMVGWS